MKSENLCGHFLSWPRRSLGGYMPPGDWGGGERASDDGPWGRQQRERDARPAAQQEAAGRQAAGQPGHQQHGPRQQAAEGGQHGPRQQAGRQRSRQAGSGAGRPWRGLESAARTAHASTEGGRQAGTRQGGSRHSRGPGLWEPCGKPATQREAGRQAAAQQGGRQGQRRHNSWRQRDRLVGRRWDHARQSAKGCRERARAPSLCPSEGLCGRNPAQGRAEAGRQRSGPWRAAASAQLAAEAPAGQAGSSR